MKKWFERRAPDREALLRHRWLRPFAHRLAHPEIWHFNRRNVARGIALGLFVGFLIPLGQVVVAALLAMAARANLLVAAMATLVTNPLTFPPIYYAAYHVGVFLMGPAQAGPSERGRAESGFGLDLMYSLASASLPTIIGLLIFASLSAIAGFGLVHLIWRLWLTRRWRARTTPPPRP